MTWLTILVAGAGTMATTSSFLFDVTNEKDLNRLLSIIGIADPRARVFLRAETDPYVIEYFRRVR